MQINVERQQRHMMHLAKVTQWKINLCHKFGRNNYSLSGLQDLSTLLVWAPVKGHTKFLKFDKKLLL